MTNKVRSYITSRPPLAIFLISLIMLVAYSIIQGIFPFGSATFLRKDLYHQYLPFLYELRRKLLSDPGLGFSFNLGLGSSFYAMYVYYLSDPLNLLCVIVPESLLLEFLTIITYLKIALSGATMCIYLRYRAPGLRSCLLITLSLCYAFSGYTASFDWNVMWMWGIALAPLAVMFFEKTINEEKGSPFIPLYFAFVMAGMIWTNYYIAMLVSIFFVIYFPVFCISSSTGIKRTAVSFLRLATGYILSAGVCAVLLLPEYAAIKRTSFSGISFPHKIKFYLSLPAVLTRGLPSVQVETGLGHEPALYASLAVLILLPLYFMCKNIPVRKKICQVFLIIFFYLSFDMNVLEYIWHGFNFPDSIPGREAFLFIIIVLAMTAEGLEASFVKPDKEKAVIRAVITAAIPAIYIIICFIFCRGEEHTDPGTWFLSFGFYAVYISIILVYFFLWGEFDKWGMNVLCIMMGFELLFNFNLTSLRDVSRENYFRHVYSFRDLAGEACRMDPLNQGHFTRLDVTHQNIRNMSDLAGYHDASYFSSEIDEAVPDFYEDYGLKSSRVHYMASGQTPFTSSILGIGYLLAEDLINNGTSSDIASFVDEAGDDYLYELNYRLPFGYAVPSLACDSESISASTDDPLEKQNDLSVLLNGDPVFERVDNKYMDEETGKCVITIPASGHYYAYSDSKVREVSEYLNDGSDEPSAVFSDMKYESVMDLGWLEESAAVTLLDEECDERLKINLYRFIPEAMDELNRSLSQTSLTLTEFKDNHIEGIVEMPKERSLVLAMPYDPDWDIVMDGGEKLEASRFAGMLMMISIPEGLHHISLTYHIPYLAPGIIISLISSVILVLYTIIARRKKAMD